MGFGITITVQDVGDIKAVELSGRIDATSAPLLEKKLETLLERKPCKIAIDFTKVDYLSSAGLRVLLSMSKKARHEGGKIALFSIQEDVMEIIQIGGFKTVLSIYSNNQDAFKALSP